MMVVIGAAIDAHFGVPEPVAFARVLTALATDRPRIEVHEVSQESADQATRMTSRAE